MKTSAALTLLSTFAIAPAALAAGSGSGDIVGLTSRGTRVVTFDAGAPGTIVSTVPLILPPGETIVGIDFRPSTGELYGVGRWGRVYIIDESSGLASQVTSSPFTPVLNGRFFGVDFNPVPDRVRVFSDADQNLRLHPDTGAVAGVDMPLAYAPGDPGAGLNPAAVAAAYSNDFAGATSTTLYAVDSDRDTLVTIGGFGGTPSPNGGQLFTVGALGVDTNGFAGLDISPFGGMFAVLNGPVDPDTRLYSINPVTGAATLQGSIGGGFRLRDLAIRPARAPLAWAVTSSNLLVSFRPGRPSAILSSVSLSGIAPGESIVGLDFRPASEGLYALSNASRLYLVDTLTGAATPVGTAPLSPSLSGSAFGFDFNPVVDRIRTVSDADQNLRLEPNLGTVASVDTPLAYAPGDAGAGSDPSVVASAYSNNSPGVSSTTLFGIDSARDMLVTQGSVGGAPVSPNGGQLFTVGSLGVDTGELAGFDISVLGGAFALLTAPGASASQLYTINLATGAATLVGTVGVGAPLTAFAFEPLGGVRAYALTASNQLISFNVGLPGALLSSVSVTGLQAGETLLGIDFRPARRTLVGLGSSSRLYSIDRITGAATSIGAGPFTPALSGNEFGVDFNPAVDRVRVVSDAGQNLRLHPVTGAVAGVDTPLAFAMADPNVGVVPRVVASAYDRNFAATFQTTLFGIDSNLDVLVAQGSLNGTPSSPNTGTLFTIGALGFDTADLAGFDLSAFGGAFAALAAPGSSSSQLLRINLTTGASTAVGTIAGGEAVRDFAILPAGL